MTAFMQDVNETPNQNETGTLLARRSLAYQGGGMDRLVPSEIPSEEA